MSVVGIDPSLTGTALAYGLNNVLTFSSKPIGGTLRARHVRIQNLALEVSTQVRCMDRMAAVFIEGPSHGQARQAGEFDRNGYWWLLADMLLIKNHPVVTVPPATLKKYATGKGNATKADMRMAWFQRANEDVRDDNAVDALWLRQIGLAATGDPTAITLPKSHTDALKKLEKL